MSRASFRAPHVAEEAARQMEAFKRYRQEQAMWENLPPPEPQVPPSQPEEVLLSGGITVIRRA